MKDFENFLKRQRFFEFKTHKIAQRLRDINGESTVLRIKGRVVRVWAIPAYDVAITDIGPANFGHNEEDIPF